MPAQNVQQLSALVRQAPDKYNASTADAGSPGHPAVAQLNTMAGASITPIHYKGGAPAMNAAMGGVKRKSCVAACARIYKAFQLLV